MQSGCLLYGRVFLDVLTQKSLSSGANADGVLIAYTSIGSVSFSPLHSSRWVCMELK